MFKFFVNFAPNFDVRDKMVLTPITLEINTKKVFFEKTPIFTQIALWILNLKHWGDEISTIYFKHKFILPLKIVIFSDKMIKKFYFQIELRIKNFKFGFFWNFWSLRFFQIWKNLKILNFYFYEIFDPSDFFLRFEWLKISNCEKWRLPLD